MIYVDFYASADTQITASDYYLGQVNLGLSAGSWTMITLECTLPTEIPAGTYYVGWIIDPANRNDENDESNNTAHNPSSLLTVVDTARTSVIYVDADARGADDGSSWGNAFGSLQDALAQAVAGCEIRVAGGVYTPDRGVRVIQGDREAAFELIDGVAIVGGYAGAGAPNADERDTAVHQTILSGDLNGDDRPVADPCELAIELSRMDNSRHVVTAIDLDRTATLDGVRIAGGRADGRFDVAAPHESQGAGMYVSASNLRLRGCVFSGNWASTDGGALYATKSNLELLRCTFCENAAGASPECRGAGGAICTLGSGLTLVSCTLNGNSSCGSGGAITIGAGGNLSAVNCCLHSNRSEAIAGAIHAFGGSLAALANCTIAGNRQDAGSGALVCESSDEHDPSELRLANCILWNDGREIASQGESLITAVYSDIRGGWLGLGNIDADPQFSDPAGADGLPGTEDDDLRLRWDSPCVDAGDTGLLPADAADMDGDGDMTEPLPLDRDGHERVVGSTVDMGAFEATM